MTIKEYLNDSLNEGYINEEGEVNKEIDKNTAIAVAAVTAVAIVDTVVSNSIKWFKRFKTNQKREKTLEKNRESKEMMAYKYTQAQKSIDKEKDENLRKKLQGRLDTIRACSVDENGRLLTPDKRAERLEELTGMDADEWMRKSGIKELSKKDEEKIESRFRKGFDKLSPEERQNIWQEERQRAKKAAARMSKKKEEDGEKEYKLTHDGKPDKLIKRPKKRGDGSTWCWASDRDTTVAPDRARAMLKKAGVKECLSLREFLNDCL